MAVLCASVRKFRIIKRNKIAATQKRDIRRRNHSTGSENPMDYYSE